MTHRERVIAALNHQPTDRVPIDLGGSATSSIHVAAYEKLVAELGIDLPEPRLMDVAQQIVEVDAAVKDALGLDVERLDSTVFERPLETPESGRYRDEWGLERHRPEGGYWFDVVNAPLSGPITIQDILSYPWPEADDPGRYEGLGERARELRQQTDRAICIGLTGPFVHYTQFLRGFEDWYCDLAADQELMSALMDAVVDIMVPSIDRVLEQTADYVDIAFLGDDLGQQQGLQVSPATYRKVIKPRQARIFEAVRRGAPHAFIAYHTCGSVVEVLDDLVELGVQVLNPVQVAAEGMAPESLKARWGDRLSFWGGVDTQRTLPHGMPDDVRREVRERVRVLGEGGGYICGAVHNVQAEVPAANVVAMFDEVRRIPSPAA